MRGNLCIDHLALALAHRGHVDGDGTRHGAELRGVAHQIRDLRAPNLILTRQAVNSWDRSPRYSGAPRRQFVARIAPSPKPGACHPCRCRGSGFQTVLVEPCASLPVRALSCSPSAGQTPPGMERGSEGATRCPRLGRRPSEACRLVESLRGHVTPTLLMLHL